MTLSYQDIHGGDAPEAVEEATLWNYAEVPVEVVGVCSAISYRTAKAGIVHTWRHEFRLRPRLLRPGGACLVAAARRPPRQAVAVGQLVDLELADGTRVVAPDYLVVTDQRGSSVWLASRVGDAPLLALEQLKRGPVVTRRGIER